jgi:dienelactone hydrolase
VRLKPARKAAQATATLCTAVLFLAACSHDAEPARGSIAESHAGFEKWANPGLTSLSVLSLEALRARSYGSSLQPELKLGASAGGAAYRDRGSRGKGEGYDSFVASYDSDGNRVYVRIDLPNLAAPASGYPVLIFVHGWYGKEAAPDFDFMIQPDSLYSRYIDAFADAGFLVLSPALRGHGTVKGIPAQGMAFLDAWDNASYLSPVFYAIDIVNLLEGVRSIETIDWTQWGHTEPVRIDPKRIGISGHSQGGDAALTTLAVSGEGSSVRNSIAAGSIWSGCFGPRLEQARIYGPMASTLEAFMSGDGSWTGSATARDGRVNPNFTFGWPSDWIVTVDTASPEWTWQADTWSVSTVAEVLQTRHREMYQAINDGVADIRDATFELVTDPSGRTVVKHDSRLRSAMKAIDAYHHEEFLSEPLHLHHSDQDYYSIPEWNADLASRVNAAGWHAVDYLYPRNTHSLLVSPYRWFSPGETVAGQPYMIQRDLALFIGGTENDVRRRADEPLSISAIRRYAAAVNNEFTPEFKRPDLDGLSRRVVSFQADGLKQYALILEPAGPPPTDGWPVLLMNHGHHPNPPDYGRIADGRPDRPGDYYR